MALCFLFDFWLSEKSFPYKMLLMPHSIILRSFKDEQNQPLNVATLESIMSPNRNGQSQLPLEDESLVKKLEETWIFDNNFKFSTRILINLWSND